MPLTKPTSEQVEFLNAVNLPGDLAVVGALTVGSVNASAVTGPGTIPLGGIIMWSGSTVPTGWALCNGQIVNSLQTPNLVDKFVIGGLSYSAGAWQTTVTGANTPQGGNKDSVLVAHTHTPSLSTDTVAAHSHGISNIGTSNPGNHAHNYNASSGNSNYYDMGFGGNGVITSLSSSSTATTQAGGHTHTLTGTLDAAGAHSHAITGTISSAGTGAGTNENLPPYFALAYIMRVL